MKGERVAGSAPAVQPVDVDRVRRGAFALADTIAPGEGGWHAHRFHQLLYAARGALRLEAEEGTWLLPPQRAAWIGAGVRHRVAARAPVDLRTVYFAPRLVGRFDARCRVFSASPLAREMILEAMRWDHQRPAGDPLARAFFAALALLARGWATDPGPFHLPVARGEELRRAAAWIDDHLADEVSLGRVARAAHTSPRTLLRRFEDELHLSFRDYLRAARLLRAMELLAHPEARVTAVALAVGFASPSAFSAAFRAFYGESPRAFRRDQAGAPE